MTETPFQSSTSSDGKAGDVIPIDAMYQGMG